MKRTWVVLTALFFIFSSFYYLGCNKTDHPFGIYSPNGLDIPTATATPVTGAILAGVVDNNVAKSGVTVLAVDPFGVTIISITDGFGLAAFNPGTLTLGTWTIEVPTQGRYYDSSIPLTVTASSINNVTFQAGNQTISVTPVSANTYGTSNTSIAYNIVYNQPLNLNVPVGLLTDVGIPSGWDKVFQPVTIGNSVSSSAVTITKTGCSIQNCSFYFNAVDGNGLLIHQVPTTINRGFTIPLSLNISGGATFVPGPSGSAHTDYTLNCNFSSSNDCNYSYPVSINGSHLGGATGDYGQTFSFISGGSRTIVFSSRGSTTNEIISATIYSPVGQFSGSFTTNATFSTTVINTSY